MTSNNVEKSCDLRQITLQFASGYAVFWCK